jgi:hypothetical protein
MGGAVVDDPEHAGRGAVGLHRHHLIDQAVERGDTGLGLAASPWHATANVPGDQILKSTPALVVAPDQTGLAWARRNQATPTGLNAGLLIGRDDLIGGGERQSLPDSLIEVEDARALNSNWGSPG